MSSTTKSERKGGGMGERYCVPWNAGLGSTSRAVEGRIKRLLKALDNELTGWVVDGPVAQEVAYFRSELVQKLRIDGWTISYGTNDRLTVKAPRGEGESKQVRELRAAVATDPLDQVARLALADALEEEGKTEQSAKERKTARRAKK